jgi:hypothetical protein
MPKYTVNREFWWKGLKRPVDSTVTMTDAEGKYLTHILTPVSPIKAAPAPVTVSKKATAAPAPQALGVAVAEGSNGAAGH